MLFLSVHRIGRTGRSSKTGIATTFINKSVDESILLDLKHLLIEAKQKVPPFLHEIEVENEELLNLGGETHVLIPSTVPKLERDFLRSERACICITFVYSVSSTLLK